MPSNTTITIKCNPDQFRLIRSWAEKEHDIAANEASSLFRLDSGMNQMEALNREAEAKQWRKYELECKALLEIL